MSITTTARGAQRRGHRWNTEEVWVSQEERQTHTLVCVLVTFGPHTADNTFAAFLAPAINTHLWLTARVGRRALVWETLPTREWVAIEARLALTGGTITRNDAV